MPGSPPPSFISAIVTLCALRSQGGGYDQEDQDDLDLVAAKERPVLKKPPRYRVVLLNDDYTPMEFVVGILQKFFSMDFEKAVQVMLLVHTSGSAVCGVYTRDIAQTKSDAVNEYAQQHEHPLLSKIEAED